MSRGPGAAAARPRFARVLGPPDAHNTPGPRAGTGYPGGGRGTLTCRASGRSRRETAGAVRAGWRRLPRRGGRADGRRLRGAAVSSADGGGRAAPPVVLRAAAPPLPRAGRAGRAALWAPRPRLRIARQSGSLPRAPRRPTARPPRPLTRGCSGSPCRVSAGTPGCRDRSPRRPCRCVQSTRGGSAGVERRGPECPQRSGPGAVGEGFNRSRSLAASSP